MAAIYLIVRGSRNQHPVSVIGRLVYQALVQHVCRVAGFAGASGLAPPPTGGLSPEAAAWYLSLDDYSGHSMRPVFLLPLPLGRKLG
jgi:hypothetical protein